MFEMGTGVTSSLWAPTRRFYCCQNSRIYTQLQPVSASPIVHFLLSKYPADTLQERETNN